MDHRVELPRKEAHCTAGRVSQWSRLFDLDLLAETVELSACRQDKQSLAVINS